MENRRLCSFLGRALGPLLIGPVLLLIGCATSHPVPDVPSGPLAACGALTAEGQMCAIPTLALQPTQMAVGGRVVDRRKAQLATLDEAALENQIRVDAAPVIRGPGGRFYMIDRHHFLAALARLGHKSAAARLEHDLSTLSSELFRRQMESKGWVHLYDERGRGPRPWSELPRDISRLKDDPYRSLAADVRDRGGYKRSNIPFAEFQWANYFRKRITIGASDAEYEAAVIAALALAHAPEAHRLPGFEGR